MPDCIECNLTVATGSLQKALRRLLKVEQAAKALNQIAYIWQQQVERRMPVDTGAAKENVLFDEATPARLEAYVGSNIDYVAKLEFGHPYVASGQVLDWLPGQKPITEWYAKSLGPAGNDDEFMPPFRGSFETIQDSVRRIMLDLPRRIIGKRV